MDSVIVYSITTVLLLFFWFLIRKDNASNIEGTNGDKILRLSTDLKYISLITIFVTVVSSYLLIGTEFIEINAIIALTALSVIFGLISLYFLLSIRNYRLIYSTNGIKYINLFKKVHIILWNNIEKVELNTFSGHLIVKTNDNGIFKILPYFKGINDFIDYSENKLDLNLVKLKNQMNWFKISNHL